MVKAVVFDVGHVLYDWDIRRLYAQLIPDADRLDWFCANVVTNEWHYQHDAGRAFAETGPELIARFPDERALIEAFGPRWLETMGDPMPGMPALVERLRARGVPLFAITNFSAEFWAMFRPTAPMFDAFGGIVVSGEERVMKPDPAIYRLAQARFGLGAGKAIFVDDKPANVAGAEAVDWLGHHFTGAAGLERRLAELGLL